MRKYAFAYISKYFDSSIDQKCLELAKMSNYWVILQTKIHIICVNAYVCIYGLLHFLSVINKFVFTQMCICTYAHLRK